MPPWMNSDRQPCGTPAGARRHNRHGEPACPACLEASRRDAAERAGHHPGAQAIDRRETRNGLPEFKPYRYQGTGQDVLTGWM